MKKVLFIGHDALRTGAPVLLLNFLKWLRQNSDLSFEILLRNGGPLFPDFEQAAPTRFINCGLITNSKISFLQRVRRKLWCPPLSAQIHRLYPASQFPLIYSNTLTNTGLVRDFASAGQKVICHAHEMRMAMQRWGGPNLPDAVKLTDTFIACSLAVRRDLREELQIPSEKIEVVNEFGQPRTLTDAQYIVTRAKIRAELGLDENTIAIGACGTVDWRKGADQFPALVQRVKELQNGEQKYRFFWIGGDPSTLEYLQLKHDLRQLGIGDIASVIDVVPNPQDYFSALDIFALLSREDPFPLVMLETAALAIPLICFERSGGAEELISAGAGVAVPYLDVDRFAQQIIRLGADKELRREIGRKGQAKILSEFTLETQAPKLLAIINRCMAETLAQD